MLIVLTLKSSSLMEQLSPTCWHPVVRRQSLIMQHRFSCHTSHLSYSIQSVRVDVVWDEYMPDSSKTDTRTKRGRGIRRRVEPSSSIPGNWQPFLRIDENNAELFSFLATRLAAQETEKQVISTLHMPESSQVLLHVHMKKHIPGCCSRCMMM